MFRIGEFSQIARVSGRLLRYYDSLGLLRPERIDPQTGYRYYSASQLPRLNRILALKELGLTLDQVAKLIEDDISPDEIRGMLLLKKSEIEQAVEKESTRLRHVESRLQQIEQAGALADYDVVIKPAKAQPYLFVHSVFPSLTEAVAMLRDVARTVAGKLTERTRDKMTVVAHSDFDDEHLELDIGFALKRAVNKRIALPGSAEMKMGELPSVESLATLVRSGPNYQSHQSFGALGLWMEANGYQITGPCREVFLEVPFLTKEENDPIVEIQFPVTKSPWVQRPRR